MNVEFGEAPLTELELFKLGYRFGPAHKWEVERPYSKRQQRRALKRLMKMVMK